MGDFSSIAFYKQLATQAMSLETGNPPGLLNFYGMLALLGSWALLSVFSFILDFLKLIGNGIRWVVALFIKLPKTRREMPIEKATKTESLVLFGLFIFCLLILK